MNHRTSITGSQTGFSLLELVIGMFIFAVGMLSLAALQGHLTRSMADASARSIATNIAEEEVELLRSFGRLDTDPANLIPAYEDIGNSTSTVTRGGANYTVNIEVTDYYYNQVTDRFTTTNTDGLLFSDFKDVTLNVSWGPTAGFQISESQNISSADMNTGNIRLSDVISSVTSQNDGRTGAQDEWVDLTPEVSYTPGANPDIVSLQLGETRFKESTTPLPRVYRTDERMETRFDVITYSQSDAGALFLRREEFVGVSCVCTLNAPPMEAEAAGRRPTLWFADEYIKGDFAIKPYGTSASNQQSIYCDECCRDHHDGGTVSGDTAAALYNPFRDSDEYWDSGSFTGDHQHYGRNVHGELVLAQATGVNYLEACRMVRVDGFMRVGQNFRQEGRNLFPENYLDETDEVSDYSAWVTTSTNAFENTISGDYESSPPTMASPPLAPAENGFPTSTTLPTPLGNTTQQLRSRGVYIDYLSDDLRSVIDCLRALPTGSVASDCDSDSIQFDHLTSTNVLEVIPFFDLQLTWLNRWSESPSNQPVDTTNEPILTDNQHSRGLASITLGSGDAQVTASGHAGNLGLTDTDPVDPGFASHIRAASLTVTALTETPPLPVGSVVIAGNISSGVPGLRGTDILVEGVEANCNRLPEGFICEFDSTSTEAAIKVYNYKKQNLVLAACSITLTQTSSGTDANGRGFAYFNLSTSPPLDDTIRHDVWIQQGSCSA